MDSKLTPWAQQRVDARVGKASRMGGNLFGSIIMMAIVFGGIYGLMMGIPYLYHRATVSWAGSASSPSSLLGVWVGEVPVTPPVDSMAWEVHHKPVSTGPSQRAAVMLDIHMQFMWGVPKVKGTATVCVNGEPRRSPTFTDDWIQDVSRIRLDLYGKGGPTDVATLLAQSLPARFRCIGPCDPANRRSTGTT